MSMFPGPIQLALVLFLAAGSSRGEIVIKQKSPAPAGAPGARPGIVVPPPAGVVTLQHEDRLEFLNGDLLRGTFLALDPQGEVRWQHPAIRQVLSVKRERIARIVLDRPAATNNAADQTCGVRLTNEDELVGQLVGLDEEHLRLNTWFAGTVQIARSRLASLSPGTAVASALYEGPKGLEGWTVAGARVGAGAAAPAWTFVDGEFVSTAPGTIGRDLKIPPVSNIEFDVTRSGFLQLAVCIYSTRLDRYGGDAYMFQFNSSSVYLQRMVANGGSSSLGNVQVPALSEKVTSRISIRSNREEKSVSLLVDGTLVKTWTDAGEFSPGTSLVFVQQGQGTAKVGQIRVSIWDGKFDEPDSAITQTTEDFIQLANSDKITGKVKAIQDGKMSLVTEFANLDVPLERVTRIEMAEAAREKDPPASGDVRALFAGSGSITFALERWDDRQVTGTSPSLGKVRMTPAAFTELVFNLDQPHPAPVKSSGLGDDIILFE